MAWFEPLLSRPPPHAVIEAWIWMAILAHQKSLHLSRRQSIATAVLSEYKRTNYGDVEIASQVGWEAYKRVADGIM